MGKYLLYQGSLYEKIEDNVETISFVLPSEQNGDMTVIKADERVRLHEQLESLEKEKLDLVRYGGDKTLALGYSQAIADVKALLAERISEQS